MTSFMRVAVTVAVAASLTGSTGAFAQTKPGVEINLKTRSGDQTLEGAGVNEPVVKGLPYSGEGITTVKLTMFDGTKTERTSPQRHGR